MEEIKWIQRSREANLKDRDQNTSSFNKLANARARFNSLAKLIVDGMLIEVM